MSCCKKNTCNKVASAKENTATETKKSCGCKKNAEKSGCCKKSASK